MANKERLYISVFNQISKSIRDGEFPVGSRLPTERELAERFSVSRPTIREAIIALEAKEEVSVKAGSGVYVLGSNLLSDDFSREISAFEILEARVLLEGEAAALAAKVISSEELNALNDALYRLELDDMESDMSSGVDREFHSIIAKATNNRVIAKQISFLWDIQDNLDHIKAAHQSVCRKGKDTRLPDHKAIYDAIATGNAAGAREAMRNHFTDLLEAMHAASERQAVEAAQQKINQMRERFSIGTLSAVE